MTHLDQTAHRPWRLSLFPLAALALVASFAAGCGKDSSPLRVATGPDALATDASSPDLSAAQGPAAGNNGRVDLTTGNRGVLEHEFRTTLVYDDPSIPPDEEIRRRTTEWVIAGPAIRDRIEYVRVQETFEAEEGPGTLDFLYRQDRSGYYQVIPFLTNGEGAEASPELAAWPAIDRRLAAKGRSVEVRAAFRRALEVGLASANDRGSLAGPPGEALRDETTLLAYPLHARASWPEQEGFPVRYRVVGKEKLSLPAGEFSAWRVEDLAGVTGIEHHRTLWYSTPGLIAEEGGARLPVLENGERIGTMQHEWSIRLIRWAPANP